MVLLIEILVGTYLLVIPAAAGYIIHLYKSHKKERKALIAAMLRVSRGQLIDYHEQWTLRRYRTLQGTDAFVELHEAYKALGGNGMMEYLYKDVMSLPLKERKGSYEKSKKDC